ncbi:MAG: PrgI family protein [Patescibacteria group bacterium]
MDQHPVPQNISSYEFRLVGDMTLKQFFQLAGGVIGGVIIFRLPLPFFLKYPLAGLSILLGVMLAFVPVSGRPFSQWIVAFIRAVYSPTEYQWAESLQPSALSPQPATATMNHEPRTNNPLDLIENQLIARFSQIFTNPSTLFSPLPSKIQLSPTPKPPAATTNHELITNNSLPAPERPNLLAGQVLDPAGLYLEGVILELSDASGLPVRALRTNKLGQFMTATPLASGPYTLSAEKEGFTFPPLSLQIENKIINPITISAHA